MSRFEIIRGPEGCCIALDDTRIAGPKPWGGGKVVLSWETSEDYAVRDTCEAEGSGEVRTCSNCHSHVREHDRYCHYCGARLVVDA